MVLEKIIYCWKVLDFFILYLVICTHSVNHISSPTYNMCIYIICH